MIKIALAGNPNSGKTTLFNALTGMNQYVGNWPGVTVEKKEGKLKGETDVILTDLPGVYSLSPYSLEEVVARNYLLEEAPDAILNIVDGTNLERNLYLTTQLIELGIPLIVAINMMDIVEKRGDKIDIKILSDELGCEVLTFSALKEEGIEEVKKAAIKAAKEGLKAKYHRFSGAVEHALAHIEEAAIHNMASEKQRFYAVKIFERDEKVIASIDKNILAHIENDIKNAEAELDDDAEAIIANERYEVISHITSMCYDKKSTMRNTISDKIDKVVTNRVLALPIFAVLMFLVYFISMKSVGDWTVGFMNDTLFGGIITPWVEGALETLGTAAWLNSLIVDGIIAGVGAVLGFVPQMMILFLLLSLLEDCGYMSRIAFIMDKLFRKFGLSGKSFIPMLVSSGCGVPGVMATRTIESVRDRRMTIMTTCFIPCGAKMPIVAFIAGALFNNSPLIATSAYFMGVLAVVISGLMLKKTKPFSGKPVPFVMELPSYHAPLPKNVLRTMWDRGFDFIKRASSVILASSVVIWLLNSFSFEGGFHYIQEVGGKSILEVLGNLIAWIFAPLGFGHWTAAVATILGLVAKEEVVGALETMAEMGSDFISVSGGLSAYSFMAFNLLCAPCFAAMSAIKREMGSRKWTWFAIGYMCAFAYAVSLMIYQFGTFIKTHEFNIGTIFASVVLVIIFYFLLRKNRYKED